MDDERSWTDLGLRAVNLGRTFTRSQLPAKPGSCVERVVVPEEPSHVDGERGGAEVERAAA